MTPLEERCLRVARAANLVIAVVSTAACATAYIVGNDWKPSFGATLLTLAAAWVSSLILDAAPYRRDNEFARRHRCPR